MDKIDTSTGTTPYFIPSGAGIKIKFNTTKTKKLKGTATFPKKTHKYTFKIQNKSKGIK